MQPHAKHTNDLEPGPPGHLRRAGVIAVGLMAVGLLVAACSLPGQAHDPQSSGSSTPSPLAYSRCMRSHGVPNFPDPKGNGELAINGDQLGIDPASPQFQAADKACKSLLPQGGGKKPTQQDKAQILKYAQCMRDHGISDFPDPSPDGGVQIEVKPGSDLAPDNPQFQAADKACKQYMPGGGAGGSVHSQNG